MLRNEVRKSGSEKLLSVISLSKVSIRWIRHSLELWAGNVVSKLLLSNYLEEFSVNISSYIFRNGKYILPFFKSS